MNRSASARVGIVLSSLFVLPLVSAAAMAAELTVLPPLVTALGEFEHIGAVDINKRGQVAGTAFDEERNGVAAYRYTPGVGMEDLDPNGEYRSRVWSMSSKGDVFGLLLGGPVLFEDPFVYRDGSGFDFLEKGLTDEVRERFVPGFQTRDGLPRSGSVAGGVWNDTPQGTRVTPWRYTRKRGWREQTGLDPRFETENAFVAYLNSGGYQVFHITGPPAEGIGRQELIVRRPNGAMIPVVSPGRPTSPGSLPNRRGRMAGTYKTEAFEQRAYVFTPQTGLVDIHPDGFTSSFALHASRDGAVAGGLASKARTDHLFLHTDEDGLRVVVGRDELRALAASRGVKFREAYPSDMNDRREIVGCIQGPGGFRVPILYSEARGLVDLAALVEELDVDGFRAKGCPMINDRSQVLLDGTAGGRDTVAILTLD